MSSGISGTPQHGFLSTHNALHIGGDDDDKIHIHVSELDGDRQTALSVFPFYDVEMVKRLIIKKLLLPPSTNITEIRIFYRGNELPNHRSLLACTTDRDKIRLQWAYRDRGLSVGVRELGIRPPPQLDAICDEINLSLQRGMIPRLTMDGTGGTYILTNTKRQNVAMFKPSDEEAFAPNNPRGYEGKLGQKGFRSGVLSGEGAQREVAAFLLDAQYGGIAGVPQTTKVEACHPSFSYRQGRNINNIPSGASDLATWKDGSLQEFVDANESCGDFNARVFSIADAHKIGILDLRVLNLDRNDGNLLVGPANHLKSFNSTAAEGELTPDGKISKYRLVPIDHGLILPDTMDLGDIDLVWYYWPQSKIEFSESELRHIFSIDADKDAQRLARKLEIREECLRTMRVSTRVLQIGARMHLNLFQIATMVLRFDDFEVPSIMERAVKTSLIQAWTAVNATSLIQQTRLPGSIMIDLQIAELPTPKESGVVRFAPYSDHKLTAESDPVQRQTVNSVRKSSRYSSLLFAPEASTLPRSTNSDGSSSNWDSWSSSVDSSDLSSDISDSESPAFSRISGVPLTNGQFRNESTIPCSGAPLNQSPINASLPSLSKSGLTASTSFEAKAKRYSTFSSDTDNNPTTRTARKRTTALSRRGTSARTTPANVNCTWSLIDSNKKPVALDWDNPLFEKTFFECFELLIRRHILETHPDWESYPFYGDAVIKDLDFRHRRRSTAHRRTDASSSSSAAKDWRHPPLAVLNSYRTNG